MSAPTRQRQRAAVPRSEQAPPPDRLALTVPEAATVLGVGQTTVYKLLRNGTLPRVRIGRATRINRAALEAYATRGDHAPTVAARR